MTPVMQTRFGQAGNCLAACVVSILDMPDRLGELSDVLAESSDWEYQRVHLARWLHPFGLTCIPLLQWSEACDEFVKGCLCIASGISPRGVGHGVVWRDGLVHDPHPVGGGLQSEGHQYTMIAPLDVGTAAGLSFEGST